MNAFYITKKLSDFLSDFMTLLLFCTIARLLMMNWEILLKFYAKHIMGPSICPILLQSPHTSQKKGPTSGGVASRFCKKYPRTEFSIFLIPIFFLVITSSTLFWTNPHDPNPPCIPGDITFCWLPWSSYHYIFTFSHPN